jgi:hypothetical protein
LFTPAIARLLATGATSWSRVQPLKIISAAGDIDAAKLAIPVGIGGKSRIIVIGTFAGVGRLRPYPLELIVRKGNIAAIEQSIGIGIAAGTSTRRGIKPEIAQLFSM